MATISKITVGGVSGDVADTESRAGLTAQRVLASSTETLGATAYVATTDTLCRRFGTYFKRTGTGTTEDPYAYTQLVRGTDYYVGEPVGCGVDLYERTGGDTHTYQSDLTAPFLADKQYSMYDKINKMYIVLTAVESSPGYYEYIPGTTTFGDKPYEVFLDDPYVYTLSTDTSVDSTKTYCLRTGSGTTEDPYVYTALTLTAGRDFNLFVLNGYSIQDMTSIVNPLIAPHKQAST